MTVRALITLLCLFSSAPLLASGNHPEAGSCPEDKPYYAVCTHSLHSLEGWLGKGCYATREEAEKEAKAHADKAHQGNMRWTGVAKTR